MNTLEWVEFEKQEAPNINPVESNQRVVCAKIRTYEDELGFTHQIVDWVHVVTGRGIHKTFHKNACGVSSEGIKGVWGGMFVFDLTEATHWSVIEVPNIVNP